MERKIYIPEVWVIFWAAGHVAQRNVRFFQLKQLEKLLENTVKNEFRYKMLSKLWHFLLKKIAN